MIKVNSILDKFKSRPSTGYQLPPETGLYQFEFQQNGARSKVHLRLDSDGNGLLMVNASRIVHLNPTASVMAYLYLNHIHQDQVVNLISKIYKAKPSQVNLDYAQLAYQISELIKPDGACPIHDLDIDTIPPFNTIPSAPYRMDLALTYRCNNDCSHCYNSRSRDYPELQTESWLKILDRVWEIGIPHVVFTGGEPTLRNDLPVLIAHAEHNGQITGINTNGRRLSDPEYVEKLVKAGLDHVQITIESHDSDIHDSMVRSHGAWKQTVSGLTNVLDTSLYVMTNTTMLESNSNFLRQTLQFLAAMGVPTVGLNALIYSGKGLTVNTGLDEKDLSPLLTTAREITEQHNQRLIWYTPTQYCNFDPMQLELGIKGCSAARYNMCVEPNGDVIPCQSYYHALGNILSTPWNDIWNHDLSINLRERKSLPEKCTNCALVTECGGGCPLILKSMVKNS